MIDLVIAENPDEILKMNFTKLIQECIIVNISGKANGLISIAKMKIFSIASEH